MKKVRWGILSTAKIGRQQVIPAIQESELCSVDAISSRTLQNANSVASLLKIPKAYGSYEELLQDDEIDAIYNPLPNHLHVPWTLKALEAGKHVLCEKPIALSAEEADKLLMESKKYPHLKVMEAFMYRFHPQMDKIKDLLNEQEIGNVQVIHSVFTYYNDDPENIRNKPDIGGGGLMDIGCYCISIARYLFNTEPVKVTAHIEKDPELGTDRITSGMLVFPNGSSNFTCSTQLSPDQSLKIFGTKGRIEVEDVFNIPLGKVGVITITKGEEIETFQIPPANQYTLQADAFAKAILDNTPVPTPLNDAFNNMRVIDAVFESGKTQKFVFL